MEAYLYNALDNLKVQCHLCRHRCQIKDGKRGICGVRVNDRGALKTLVYDRLIARHVDPIEKKPLFHFYPGSRCYSVATAGCNFKCRFCQNADIAQMPHDKNGLITGESTTPQVEVEMALEQKCQSIAFTYTEPTIFFEFAYATAKLAKSHGIHSVFVTNGYMTPEALDMITPYLDAANVDLKAFSDNFYKKMCAARLDPVLDTLKRLKTKGVLLEVTTLLISGLNDDMAELTKLASFIANQLGPDTPWHISRFHPTYRLIDRPPTPLESLITAYGIGKKAGLRYVYLGNVPGHDGEKTICYQCGRTAIDRLGFSIEKYVLDNGCCHYCGTRIDGVGM